MLGSGYALSGTTEVVAFGDSVGDTASSSAMRTRIFTRAKGQIAWTESQFSGTDPYGNAVANLGLFDNTSSNAMPALSITRSPALTSGTDSQSPSTSYTGLQPLNQNKATVTLFTAAAGMSGQITTVSFPLTAGVVNVCLCNASATSNTSTLSVMESIVPGTVIATTPSMNGSTATFTLDDGTHTAALVAGQVYALVILSTNSTPAGLTMCEVLTGYYWQEFSGASLNAGNTPPLAGTPSSGVYDGTNSAEFTLSVNTTGAAVVSATLNSSGTLVITLVDTATPAVNHQIVATTLTAIVSEINGLTDWTASIPSGTTTYFPGIGTSSTQMLLPFAGAQNANGVVATLQAGLVPLGADIGSSNDGSMLVAINRVAENASTVWLTGCFYDGHQPYDQSHWGSEFLIAGGLEANAYQGDLRAAVKLPSGQWLVSNDGVGFLSAAGLSNTQIAAGYSADGYRLGNTVAWQTTPSALLQSWYPVPLGTASINDLSLGVEVPIISLGGNKVLAVGRNATFANMSLGTVSGNTITWVDPTDATRTYCVCDGGVNGNGNRRPYLWSGSTPISMCLLGSNVIFVTAKLPNVTESSGLTRRRMHAWQLPLSQLAATGSLTIQRSQFGAIANVGEYLDFKPGPGGVLCGAVGIRGPVGCYFNGGLATTGGSAGNNTFLGLDGMAL